MSRWVILVVMLGACASGRINDGSGGGGGGGNNNGQVDAPTGGGGNVDAPASTIDAPPGGGGGLDPDLELPDPSGQVCHRPSAAGFADCPSGYACRYFTPTEGRCETCSGCEALGRPCDRSADCDTLFLCYRKTCTNYCTIGTIECGPVEDCIDIGHATRGVCRV